MAGPDGGEMGGLRISASGQQERGRRKGSGYAFYPPLGSAAPAAIHQGHGPVLLIFEVTTNSYSSFHQPAIINRKSSSSPLLPNKPSRPCIPCGVTSSSKSGEPIRSRASYALSLETRRCRETPLVNRILPRLYGLWDLFFLKTSKLPAYRAALVGDQGVDSLRRAGPHRAH